jgi:hypothetical protein
MVWDEIYKKLLDEYNKANDNTILPPPVPLILNGWVFSTGLEKALRWKETVEWAEKYGFSSLVPPIQDNESFYV